MIFCTFQNQSPSPSEPAAAADETITESEQPTADASEPTDLQSGTDLSVSEDTDTPQAPSDADLHSESSEKPSKKKRIGRVLLYVLLSMCAAVVLFFGITTAALFYLSRPTNVDLDTQITLGALEKNPVLAYFCHTDADPASIDTSAISDQTIPLTFFGVIDREWQIRVRDLTPPAVTLRDLVITQGLSVCAEDFILSSEDKTEITFTFVSQPDVTAVGTQTVTVCTTDIGKNKTEVTAALTVIDAQNALTLELRRDKKDDLLDIVTEQPYSFDKTDLSQIDFDACGEYRLLAEKETEENTCYHIAVAIADTTPPSIVLESRNLLMDQTATPEKFIVSMHDASEMSFSFVNEPDYECFEEQQVEILAQDVYGNSTVYTTTLLIWEIPSAYTVECGTTTLSLQSKLFSDVSQNSRPKLEKGFSADKLPIGTHEIAVVGAYSTETVLLTVEDTTSPMLVLHDATVYRGKDVLADDLVESVKDASPVTVSFVSEPDVSEEQSLTVQILCVDAAGNQTIGEATLHVVRDGEPPVISGLDTLYITTGEPVSYKRGVRATDNADGTVSVSVDASAVDTSTPGAYSVKYTAQDAEGNRTTKYRTVIVSTISQSALEQYARDVLARITTAGMTDRQKARAIYDWCKLNISYTTMTAHLIGSFIPSVHYSFNFHVGNCYGYYAAASMLLDSAGIENMMIQRKSYVAAVPHYWNLVKIDGNWYHMDTCPSPASAPLTCFLLTDAEVAHYSTHSYRNYYTFDTSLYPRTP
ncbi:MAG: transglutaminase domain-containing protein [Clostridia bacterium]|nr:transglutaminase domain-containing protein [Clostridia bacterium]